MRSKEESHDYRYFPDPDLPPLVVSREAVERTRDELPEMPIARRERLRSAYALPFYDADVLARSRETADYFERTFARAQVESKVVANWVLGPVLALINERGDDARTFTVARDPGARDPNGGRARRIGCGRVYTARSARRQRRESGSPRGRAGPAPRAGRGAARDVGRRDGEGARRGRSAIQVRRDKAAGFPRRSGHESLGGRRRSEAGAHALAGAAGEPS